MLVKNLATGDSILVTFVLCFKFDALSEKFYINGALWRILKGK